MTMTPRDCGIATGLLITIAIMLAHYNFSQEVTAESLLADVPAPEILSSHSKEFNIPQIIKVTEGIHMAIGYALGNSILLDAPEGLIIVDTTESMESAREVYTAFREISDKPIKAIIYTHNHPDHVYGAAAFLEDRENIDDVEIWAHELLVPQLTRQARANPTVFARGIRQFGCLLPQAVNAGIGFTLKYGEGKTVGILEPNKILHDDEKDVRIAGLDLKLIHIPGETPDQMGVWIPGKEALLCADDIYKSFPNLYAIRGTPSRNILTWAESIDKMRDLNPEYLVPSHTRPVIGKETIYNLLTDYRDAIQFVHDQTVRFMNKGMHPEDIPSHVKLPERLANHPFLLEFYGTVEWSVKAVYHSYIGWFSGDIVDLMPLTPKEKSQRTIDLAGGVKAVLSAARKALSAEDWKWALELASHVFRLNPDDLEARCIRLEATKVLASQQTSANGRNYYLTMALEDHKLIENKISNEYQSMFILKTALSRIFQAMILKIKAEEVEGIRQDVVFHFTDTEEIFSLQLRNSIIELGNKDLELFDIKVTTTSKVWKEVVAKVRSPLVTYMGGDIQIEGGVINFYTFIAYFD